MKVTALCHAGLVRSRAMAEELYRRGLRAMCGGLMFKGTPLLEAQLKWADWILVMDEELLQEVPRAYWPKVTLADLGPDVWGNHEHPDLKNRVRIMAEEWQKNGWKFKPLRLRPKGPVNRLRA